MQFCYVDEAGCTGVLPSASCDIQPVLVVVGVVIPHQTLAELTREFIHLKRAFFPANRPRASTSLDWIAAEAKDPRCGGRPLGRPATGAGMRSVFSKKRSRSWSGTTAGSKGRIWVKGLANRHQTVIGFSPSSNRVFLVM